MNYHSLEITEYEGAQSATLKDGVELTPALADEIRSFPGKLSIADISQLPLDFLTTLLEGFNGDYLSLLGDFKLSPEAAEALSRFKGGINLNDVTDLPEDVAAALAKHEGELDLNGLSTLTEASGLQLAKHVKCVGLENLDFDNLPSSVVEAFGKAWPDVWGNA
jgi:hypothetical protein